MHRFTVLLIACAFASLAHADDVQIAVAANFTAPMKQIAAQFEQETGHKVLATFGSTGKFYAQIKNGAPFEVLLSADDQTPAKLEEEGAGVANTRFTYAIGKLVLWSAQPGMVDSNGDVLKKGAFEHLAIADPKLAPYGAAAVSALRKLQLLDLLAPKFVRGDNIAQTHQFVVSGAAALGFVAAAQVYEDGKLKSGSAWLVPATLYNPLRQDALLLEKGKGKPAAVAFLRYMKSKKALIVMRSYGYAL